MSCTKEEIEKKRIAALQKRQSKLSPIQSHGLRVNNSFVSHTNRIESKFRPVRRISSHYNPHPYKTETTRFPENSLPMNKVISGSTYLISEDRFEVNSSEFCSPLINVFKNIPSKNYDGRTKLWNFSLKDYHDLMSRVAPLAPYIVLGSIPHYVLKVLQDPVIDPNSIDLSPIEATLRNKLMPFQEEGVRFGIARRGRCMIADDMGLGKTFQALAIASYYRDNWPLLVVTTSSMRETWQSKIHELIPSVPLMNIVTLSSGKDTQLVADKQTEVVIVSFKITTMHTDLLKTKKFGVVIIDESHNLKSHKAQCTLSLTGICTTAARVVLLSGTPALSRPAELFTQLNLIAPKLFPNYTEYGKRYCAGKQTNFGWDMSGQSNLAELQIILQRRFLIRRTKEQVLDKLEGRVRETVLLDETLLQHCKDNRGLTEMAQSYQASKSSEKHAALLRLFSESARVKVPAVCKYLKQLINNGSEQKFLIFAHHKVMIDAICLQLDELSVGYICIVGSTPGNVRADLVERFQAGACRAAVLSTLAVNAGLSLCAASLVLFAELHWNPGILTQAESRAHRIGQQSQVVVRYLLARGTVDDFMWPMLRHKLNVLNDVGLCGDNFEETTMKHQESKCDITQYLTQSSPILKNKNNYIPGTNIPLSSINQQKLSSKNIDRSASKVIEHKTIDVDQGKHESIDAFGDNDFFDEESLKFEAEEMCIPDFSTEKCHKNIYNITSNNCENTPQSQRKNCENYSDKERRFRQQNNDSLQNHPSDNASCSKVDDSNYLNNCDKDNSAFFDDEEGDVLLAELDL